MKKELIENMLVIASTVFVVVIITMMFFDAFGINETTEENEEGFYSIDPRVQAPHEKDIKEMLFEDSLYYKVLQ